MAASTYVGVAGVNRKLTQIPVGVGGVNRACKSAWVGVAGVNRQVFVAGTPLSSKTVGSIIKLKESGAPVDFYVAKHDYESGLNGAGRTLVVRKDCYDIRNWNNGANTYSSSIIDDWLNSTYKNLLDVNVRTAIGTTKFYYTVGGGNSSITTLSRAVFLLSTAELDHYGSFGMNAEGSTLPIASTLNIAYLDGEPESQWTRTPYFKNSTNVFRVSYEGYTSSWGSNVENGSRPAFTLPATAIVNDSGEVTV